MTLAEKKRLHAQYNTAPKVKQSSTSVSPKNATGSKPRFIRKKNRNKQSDKEKPVDEQSTHPTLMTMTLNNHNQRALEGAASNEQTAKP